MLRITLGIMSIKSFQRAAGALLLMSGAVNAGPPLSIDDPGILDPGKFEVILAATIETRPFGDSYEFPVLNISLGVSENIQVAVVALATGWKPWWKSTAEQIAALMMTDTPTASARMSC